MSDNVVLNAGTGGDTIAADDVGGAKYQRVKLALGANGTADDAAVGGGVESGVLRVTIASDSTGVLSVDDNGGALTVDNGGTFAVQSTSVTPGTAAANLGKAEDAAHSDGDVGVMALAVRRDADTTLAGTTGDYAPLQVNASGSLKVAITAGAGSGGTSIADGASFTRDSTSLTPVGGVVEASAPTVTAGDAVALSLTTGGAVRVDVSSGGITGRAEDAAAAGGEDGVPVLAVRRDSASSGVSADGDWANLSVTSAGRLWVDPSGVTLTVASHAVTNAGTFATQESGTQVQVDDAAFTPATSKIVMAGFQADEAATDSIDEGDGGAARMTLDRKQIITPYAHAAAGGATPYQNLDCDETEDDIKTAAGKLFWVHAINLTAVKQYLKFYNATAANTTVGSTTPVLTFPIPTMADTNGAGFTINFGDIGVQFDTAICVAATTGFAVADTGAPATNAVILNAGFL